jgi:ABC-type branched-subunit amino acid transport system substrate-binding protein
MTNTKPRWGGLFVLLSTLCLFGAACSSVSRLPVNASGTGLTGQTRSPNGGLLGSDSTTDEVGEVLDASGNPVSSSDAIDPDSSVGASDSANTATTTRKPCTKPIKVGASYSSDLAAGLAAVGNPGAADQAATYGQTVEQVYKLGAEDINKRGGLAGCPIELDFFDFKALAADGFDGQSQQECTHFAEDAKVALVFAGALESRVLIECLHQHKIPVVFNGAEYYPAQDDFDKYRGHLYKPDGMVTDRWKPFIDALGSGGYFDKGAKVGILLDDDGSGHNQHLVNALWKPALAARGINPTVFTFQAIKGYSDVSRVSSQFASAVLQFKAAGVTHVITTPDGNAAAIFFTQEANSQGYKPRYGLTTDSGALAWSTVPDGQKPRAVAVSYRITDVLTDEVRTQTPTNVNRTRCEALYRSKNLPVAYAWCDALEVFREGLLHESTLTVASLQRGVEGLGTSFLSVGGYGATRFGPGRYDGAAQVRVLNWDTASNEWKYGPPAIAIP